MRWAEKKKKDKSALNSSNQTAVTDETGDLPTSAAVSIFFFFLTQPRTLTLTI